jgi:hypothetical protein
MSSIPLDIVHTPCLPLTPDPLMRLTCCREFSFTRPPGESDVDDLVSRISPKRDVSISISSLEDGRDVVLR